MFELHPWATHQQQGHILLQSLHEHDREDEAREECISTAQRRSQWGELESASIACRSFFNEFSFIENLDALWPLATHHSHETEERGHAWIFARSSQHSPDVFPRTIGRLQQQAELLVTRLQTNHHSRSISRNWSVGEFWSSAKTTQRHVNYTRSVETIEKRLSFTIRS